MAELAFIGLRSSLAQVRIDSAGRDIGRLSGQLEFNGVHLLEEMIAFFDGQRLNCGRFVDAPSMHGKARQCHKVGGMRDGGGRNSGADRGGERVQVHEKLTFCIQPVKRIQGRGMKLDALGFE
jgi:hypothetical protein